MDPSAPAPEVAPAGTAPGPVSGAPTATDPDLTSGRGAAAARSLLAARAVLGALAFALAAYAFIRFPATGFPPSLPGWANFVTRLVFALALLAPALAPLRVARWLRVPRLATSGGLAGYALVGAAMYFVFGLGTVVETANLVQGLQQGQSAEQLVGNIDRAALFISLTINFLVFTIPVLIWAFAVEGGPGHRAFAWLRLRRDGASWSIAWSLASVLLVFWLLIAVGLVTRAAGQADPVNDRAEAIARNLDIPSALLVAAMTGVGEEIFFRGFLLRKFGLVPQAALFGLAHLNYLQGMEVLVTALLGYAFGRTAERTGSLWGPILGHALFNATSLILFLWKSGNLGV